MSNRMRSSNRTAAALGVLLASLISAAPARPHPEDAREVYTAGTLAWLGCWRLATAEENEVPGPVAEPQLLCLEPGDDPNSLNMRALVGDRVVAEETLVTNGSKEAVLEIGCSGWKRSTLSRDRQRLYRQSEQTCESGNQSRHSGASLFISQDHWIDINVTRAGGEHDLIVRHYRLADSDPHPESPFAEPAHAAVFPGATPSPSYTARIAAASELDPSDVIEALEILDPAVVEALLVESKSSFTMDSRLLLRLDDADVPGRIIDLMMALSFPEYFSVGEEAVVAVRLVNQRSTAYGPWYGGDGYGYAYPYGYGYHRRYGYGFGHFHGHGYGYGYGYGYDHGFWHTAPDSNSPSRPRGKAISGSGYTRIEPTEMPSGGIFSQSSSAGASGGGSAGSSGGNSTGTSTGTSASSTPSGYKSDDSSSTRRAVPR